MKEEDVLDATEGTVTGAPNTKADILGVNSGDWNEVRRRLKLIQMVFRASVLWLGFEEG